MSHMAIRGAKAAPTPGRINKAGKIQALYLIDPEVKDFLKAYSLDKDITMSVLVEEAIRNTYMTPSAPTPKQEDGNGIVGMFRTLMDPR